VFNKSDLVSIMNTAELKQTSISDNALAATKQLLTVNNKEAEIKSKQTQQKQQMLPSVTEDGLARANTIQDTTKNDISGLNTRLDALIGQVAGLTEISRRQLSVQKGLSSDAFS